MQIIFIEIRKVQILYQKLLKYFIYFRKRAFIHIPIFHHPHNIHECGVHCQRIKKKRIPQNKVYHCIRLLYLCGCIVFFSGPDYYQIYNNNKNIIFMDEVVIFHLQNTRILTYIREQLFTISQRIRTYGDYTQFLRGFIRLGILAMNHIENFLF